MRKTNFLLAFALILSLCFIFVQCRKPESKQQSVSRPGQDTLLFSFVVVGCNRMDKDDTSASANPSTANVNQLLRTFSDVAAIKPLPKYLFFAGDLIIGYSPDTSVLSRELHAWRKLYEQSGLSRTGLTLVVTPGNHEVMRGKKQPAYAGAEQVWVNAMQPYIVANNGPAAGGKDRLETDQSRLTYSFDYLNTHFIVLNTDPVGNESRVPVQWIADDLAKAKKAGSKHIFAIGHKPAWPFPGEDGLSAYTAERDAFWSAMETNGAEAMITAHNHVYYRSQPHAGKTWQIIAGNGGSPLSDEIKDPRQLFFGFTLISVYTNGKVVCRSYGRDLPSNGYAGNTAHIPTTLRDSIDISLR